MKRSSISIISALVLATVVVAAGIAAAAGGGGNNVKVLGKGDSDLKPFCQKSRAYGTCLVVGSMTTFINQLGKKDRPFVAPSDGRIVAWSIELGHKPSSRPPKNNPDGKSNLEFFQDTFGSDKYGKGPVGKLAILKRKQGVEMKLVDQSPAIKFTGPFYGTETVITLDRPLPIRKGEIVGLTSLTWIPMLKPHKRGDGKSSWRASIADKACDRDAILDAKPHKKLDSVREYRCAFDDRLFYKAWFVPN